MKQYRITIPDDIKNIIILGGVEQFYDHTENISITKNMLKLDGAILKRTDFEESLNGKYWVYRYYIWPKRYFVEMIDIQNINITINGLTLEELQKCQCYKSKNMCNKYCEMLQEGKCLGGKE